jgi:hypothetical protein
VTLKVESLHAVVCSTEQYKALTMLCPHCHTVLGAALDPLALVGENVAQIMDQLQVNSEPASESRISG